MSTITIPITINIGLLGAIAATPTTTPNGTSNGTPSTTPVQCPRPPPIAPPATKPEAPKTPEKVPEPKPTTAPDEPGLAYVMQEHTYHNSPAPAYDTFSVDHFKTAPPTQQGILTSTGIGFLNRSDSHPISIYGGQSRDTAYVSLNHRGYFTPKATGTYTFRCNNYDDLLLLWVGSDAFDAAYTRKNASLELKWDNSGTSGSYSVAMKAGEYVPFRLLAANAQGLGWRGFTCSVEDPSGNVLVDMDKGTGEHFVQFSAKASAGRWKPLGSELP